MAKMCNNNDFMFVFQNEICVHSCMLLYKVLIIKKYTEYDKYITQNTVLCTNSHHSI